MQRPNHSAAIGHQPTTAKTRTRRSGSSMFAPTTLQRRGHGPTLRAKTRTFQAQPGSDVVGSGHPVHPCVIRYSFLSSLETDKPYRVHFGSWAGHRSPVEWGASRSDLKPPTVRRANRTTARNPRFQVDTQASNTHGANSSVVPEVAKVPPGNQRRRCDRGPAGPGSPPVNRIARNIMNEPVSTLGRIV